MRRLYVLTLFVMTLLWISLNASAAEKVVEGTQVAEEKVSVTAVLQRGGTIMYVLLATSMIGLTFALERAVSLRRKRHIPAGMVEEVEHRLENGGASHALRYLRDNDSILARLLESILIRGKATREEIERVLDDEIGRVLWDQRHNIRPVGIVASVSQLIGLLGTVIGMISAFQMAAIKGMDNPAHFAQGIYQALYTTAFGLTIAIPFLLTYHYLKGKADVLTREAEKLSIRVIVFMHSHDFIEADPSSRIFEDVEPDSPVEESVKILTLPYYPKENIEEPKKPVEVKQEIKTPEIVDPDTVMVNDVQEQNKFSVYGNDYSPLYEESDVADEPTEPQSDVMAKTAYETEDNAQCEEYVMRGWNTVNIVADNGDYVKVEQSAERSTVADDGRVLMISSESSAMLVPPPFPPEEAS